MIDSNAKLRSIQMPFCTFPISACFDSVFLCNCIQSYNDCINWTLLAFLTASRSSVGLPRISASMAYNSAIRLSAS